MCTVMGVVYAQSTNFLVLGQVETLEGSITRVFRI